MPLQDTECHAALRRWRGVLLKPKQTPLPCFPPKGQTNSCEGNKTIRLSSPRTEEGILRRRGSVQSDVEKELGARHACTARLCAKMPVGKHCYEACPEKRLFEVRCQASTRAFLISSHQSRCVFVPLLLHMPCHTFSANIATAKLSVDCVHQTC